jgi:hypothetical protein
LIRKNQSFRARLEHLEHHSRNSVIGMRCQFNNAWKDLLASDIEGVAFHLACLNSHLERLEKALSEEELPC